MTKKRTVEVFIPALKNANPFFDEITSCSNHTYVFDNYIKYKSHYKTVLIHWPESIFNWKEPSIKELAELQAAIEEWKKKSKIIYVVHNLERHHGMTTNFNKLYNLVEGSCDTMVHFGQFSKNLLYEKKPNIIHTIIEHPLYEKSFSISSKNDARAQLNINQNAVVIIAPGQIRNKSERKLILNSFNKLKHNNKILIVPRMFRKTIPFEFKRKSISLPFYHFKNLYDYFMNEFAFRNSKYIFKYKFLSEKELSLLISASDIVLIPRISILNSGNVFLGLTFQKIIVGPELGNTTEILNKFKMPKFNPKDKGSVVKALNKGITLINSYNYNIKLLTEFSPKTIAKKWDELINKSQSN